MGRTACRIEMRCHSGFSVKASERARVVSSVRGSVTLSRESYFQSRFSIVDGVLTQLLRQIPQDDRLEDVRLPTTLPEAFEAGKVGVEGIKHPA